METKALMSSVTFVRYGGPEVLRFTSQPQPVPGETEILIRVAATTVTQADCAMRHGEPRWGRLLLGLLGPRKRFQTLGLELSGEVAAVGSGVTRFRQGDQVFGFTGFRLGGHAQYCVLPQNASLALRPSSVTHQQAAAAVDGATTAYYFLKTLAQVRPGQRVLINGASGSIGTYAVQLAVLWGAEVTAVCGPTNANLVRQLGATKVIDYTKQDFTQGNESYDAVFDAVGKSSFAQCRRILSSHGVYLSTTGLGNYPLMGWTRLWGRKKVKTGMSVDKAEALSFVRSLLEEGRLQVLIDRTYPWDQMVEAHRYVEAGHKKGNVVVQVCD